MTTFKSQQSVARPRTTTIATMTNLVRSRPVGRRSGGQTNLLGPSRPTVALIVASLVAAAACLLVAIPSTHLQALASTTPIDSSNHERALNYLMYKSPTKQNYSGSQAASSSQQTAGAPNGSSMTTTVAGTNSNSSLSKEHLIETLLKDVNHDHMSDRVDLKLANDIWKRMHQNALEFAQIKSNEARPAIDRFLRESGVSTKCLGAIGDTLEHIGQLDDWAIQMYNSFGELPTVGFFEGTMTSMGSYYQCVNVEPNEWIERPQYCSFKFQPIIPKRRRYHNILEPVDENLANFTRKNDMLRGFAKKAQYFYYIKMRLATCMPSKCAKSDLDLIGEQIALNTYLQYQGVECLEKEGGFNPDGAQVFAMVILFALASVSLVGTLVHLLGVRSWLEPTNKRSRSSTGVARNCGSPLSSVPIELTTGAQLKAANDKQQLARQVVSEAAALENDDLENNNNNSIAQHQVPQKGVVGMPASSSGSDVSGSSTSSVRRRRSPMVRVVDVLMHFSVIANGRKLFDTSTSAGQKANSSNNNNIARKNGATNTSATAGTGNGRHRSNSGLLEGQSNDISCVHGLRFWTISWIIMGHTFQYTEWAGFARAYQVEGNITSFLLHPLLNATFSVDTFFLISGLLTTYVTWTITRGHYWRFNKFAFLISRYLRLMPQVLIVILIFIVFPMLGEGPWWRGLVQKESDRCKQNWWVSALFLQSFYRQDQICNLVTWWLSIEMFYHFTSIIVIISLLHSARKGILAALLVGGSMTGYSFYLHYANSYPPNMMPTLVQRYEIWDDIVLKYFWTPYPHAPSYFVGLLLGYALYNRSIGQLTRRQVRFGWIAFALSYTGILFGTYYWNLNAPYSREAATAYYNFSQIFWSLATGWAILACALGEGGWLNDFLSSPVFIPLGRATYMTYLSHMLIVMSYPAKMNQLLEPSYIVFLYIFISNLVLSYALGICLTLVYESPILHLQKLLVARMASKFNDDPRMKRDKVSEDERSVRVSLYTQAHQPNQQQHHHHHLLNHHQTLDTEHSTKITTSSVCH